MFPSIYFFQSAFSYTEYVHELSFVQFLSSNQTQRIKDVALAIFKRILAFFKSFHHQSKEINLKAIAMISCLSLIALLVISMLRRREGHMLAHPKPQ